LRDALTDFLSSIVPETRSRAEIEAYIQSAEIHILDGCDEAATMRPTKND